MRDEGPSRTGGRAGVPARQAGRASLCMLFLQCCSLSSFLCSLHAKPGKKHALNNSGHVPQGEGLHARIMHENPWESLWGLRARNSTVPPRAPAPGMRLGT